MSGCENAAENLSNQEFKVDKKFCLPRGCDRVPRHGDVLTRAE